MNVIFQDLRKSKTSSTAPEYTVTLRLDGKLRRFHAVVRVREMCAISFRETGLDSLLAYNMDQGRILYKSVAQLHRDHRKPALPIDLGELHPFPKPMKPKPRRAATATIA